MKKSVFFALFIIASLAGCVAIPAYQPASYGSVVYQQPVYYPAYGYYPYGYGYGYGPSIYIGGYRGGGFRGGGGGHGGGHGGHR